jgi:hypothetical protein
MLAPIRLGDIPPPIAGDGGLVPQSIRTGPEDYHVLLSRNIAVRCSP